MSYETITPDSPPIMTTPYWNYNRTTDPDSDDFIPGWFLPESAQKTAIMQATATLNARREVIHPSGPSGGYSKLVSGTPSNPDPIVSTEIFTIKVNNKPFPVGAIVMAPYHRVRVTLRAYPGRQLLYWNRSDKIGLVPELFPYSSFSRRGAKGRIYCTSPGAERYFIEANNSPLSVNTKSMTWSSFPPNLLTTPKAVFQRFMATSVSPNAQLVTSVVGKANSQSLDLLTTLAEAPQTAKSVLDGFKKIGKLSKDLRSENIALSNGFSSRRKFLQKSYDKAIARHESIPWRSLHAKKRAAERIRARRLKNERDSYSRAMSKTIEEFNSSVASLWLNYRYNIMPIVYTVDDAFEAINASFGIYSTVRDRVTDGDPSLPEFPGWTRSGTSSLTERCVVKRRYTTENKQRGIASTLSMDIPTTIWELIPYSFVIDWFVNVGDYISASLGSDFHLEQASSYSWKMTASMTYSQPSTGQKTLLNVEGYNRTVINPNNYLGLCVDPNLNLSRILDALALSWGKGRRLLIHSK